MISRPEAGEGLLNPTENCAVFLLSNLSEVLLTEKALTLSMETLKVTVLLYGFLNSTTVVFPLFIEIGPCG